ncbi:MAG TPA: hypothetical protein VJT14_08755 [Candidatus Dormibacteraeota bacterium]|nr:hypothetical protein [Candidatus Dormibacteraeota bacterium]
MGNVIPWSQIHPSITSEEPFVAVVIIDPLRQICVSEMVAFEPEALTGADVAAAELIAAAQAAATKVASGYRVRRQQAAPSATLTRKRGGENNGALTLPLPLEGVRENLGGLRVLKGGKG